MKVVVNVHVGPDRIIGKLKILEPRFFFALAMNFRWMYISKAMAEGASINE